MVLIELHLKPTVIVTPMQASGLITFNANAKVLFYAIEQTLRKPTKPARRAIDHNQTVSMQSDYVTPPV
jgi:hypothetical protein